MLRPVFCREISFDTPKQEVHFGGSPNRMIAEEDGQLLRYPIEEIFHEENVVSMEYEAYYEEEEKSNCQNNGVDELEGDVVVCEGYGYDTKEDAKRIFSDEEFYQAKANNVYYVVSVLLVAIIAKLYMSLFRMYSLRNSQF